MTSRVRAIKWNCKAAQITQPIIQSQNPTSCYLWLWGCAHTHTYPHESDFKTPSEPDLKIHGQDC